MRRCVPSRGGCGVAAEVDEPWAAPLDHQAPMPRAVQLALAGAQLAWQDAAIEADRERVGVVVGTGLGNLDLTIASGDRLQKGERVSPITAFRSFAHAAACEIARALDLRGPIQTVTSGCNAGADALGLALDWIRLGRADVVVVGGVEAELNHGFIRVMEAARALSTSWNHEPSAASRPFDRGRDGNVPGEGAAFLVLEEPGHARARRAAVRAELLGFANAAAGDRPPYNPFAPVADPGPLIRTVRAALRDARVTVEDVSLVSANGSSSVFYDQLEADAIRQIFAERSAPVPVHSIKAMLGQTGAVTPALQAIAAVLTIERGAIPPTINADDVDCEIDLVREPRTADVGCVLTQAIGFGGFYYAAAVFGRHAPERDAS